MNRVWGLDSATSFELLASYERASQGKPSFATPLIQLLQSRIPLLPSFYLPSGKRTLNRDLLEELNLALHRLETTNRSQLDGAQNPLLLSVQSDKLGTIRNLGVSPKTLPVLIQRYGEKFAYSIYIDFLENFSCAILGSEFIDFRKTFGEAESPEGFLAKVSDYRKLISQKTGKVFGDRPERHLLEILNSAGDSEFLVRTLLYRTQFGRSAQGVVYSRNPFSGSKDLYGVFEAAGEEKKLTFESSPVQAKNFSNELLRSLPAIESCFGDVMEVGFVVSEEGRLFFTTFDRAEIASRATIVSLVDLNREGKLTDQETVQRLKAKDVEMLLHPTLAEASKKNLVDVGSEGVTAAPGTAVGRIFFKMKDAMKYYELQKKKKKDSRVILVTDELLISDSSGLGVISGLITQASGIASHAAVMARANGIPCIVGYKGLKIDLKKNVAWVHGKRLKSGTLVTLEAANVGKVFLGEGQLDNVSYEDHVIQDLVQLFKRVKKTKKINFQIRVNINNPKDAEVGLHFGADAVGLCRTENMFMEPQALKEIRNIIFNQNPQKCKSSFRILEDLQFKDFKKIFQLMQGKPVNIRLMDLPMHDFVPQSDEDLRMLLRQLPKLSKQQIRLVGDSLKEHNPMLGLRACRFGLITPEVYDMQIRAIVRSAYSISAPVDPGIMFPLVFLGNELSVLHNRVVQIEQEVREKMNIPLENQIHFRVGSMIELPAAALGADHLARVGEFFAFGTNDLTQTSLGMSRDDSAHYLPHYLEQNLLSSDPFKILSEPVRELVEIAVRRGRRVRADASFGICGEQGGDPSTLAFCLEKDLDYVSCSPFRVLSAQLSLLKQDESHTRAISYKDGTGPSLKLPKAG